MAITLGEIKKICRNHSSCKTCPLENVGCMVAGDPSARSIKEINRRMKVDAEKHSDS